MHLAAVVTADCTCTEDAQRVCVPGTGDADTLTAAIVAATIKGSADSIGFFGLADRIGAAVSQTNIPSQTAIQSYSQAFAQFLLSCKSAGNCSTGASSEPNGDENAAVVLSVAGRAGQGQSFPQILTQASIVNTGDATNMGPRCSCVH